MRLWCAGIQKVSRNPNFFASAWPSRQRKYGMDPDHGHQSLNSLAGTTRKLRLIRGCSFDGGRVTRRSTRILRLQIADYEPGGEETGNQNDGAGHETRNIRAGPLDHKTDHQRRDCACEVTGKVFESSPHANF